MVDMHQWGENCAESETVYLSFQHKRFDIFVKILEIISLVYRNA